MGLVELMNLILIIDLIDLTDRMNLINIINLINLTDLIDFILGSKCQRTIILLFLGVSLFKAVWSFFLAESEQKKRTFKHK